MNCPYCDSYDYVKNGTYKTEYAYIQKFKCKACEKFYIYNEVKGDKKPELNSQILDLAKEGYSRRAIAMELGISKRTVDKKLKKYQKKTGPMGRPKKKTTTRDLQNDIDGTKKPKKDPK
jgi:transposase-like protein